MQPGILLIVGLQQVGEFAGPPRECSHPQAHHDDTEKLLEVVGARDVSVSNSWRGRDDEVEWGQVDVYVWHFCILFIDI